MPKKIFTLELENTTPIVVETGELAQQTNGSAVVKLGETMVLATAVMSRNPLNVDFLPLIVNYHEKTYAAGLIKHSPTNKREAKPSDDNILTARMIDRTIRPIFPKGLTNDIQTICTTLSFDDENEHDIASAIASSVAFSISDIPFYGPTATLRVGLINDKFVINPTNKIREKSTLDLIVSCTEDAVIMIEAGANEISEEKMLEAIDFGHQEGKKICKFISEIVKEIGKEKIPFEPRIIDERIEPMIKEKYLDEINNTIFDDKLNKLARFAYFDKLKNEAVEAFSNDLNKDKNEDATDYIKDMDIKNVFDKVMKGVVRESILKNNKRIKGRKLDEIRPLSCSIDICPRTHGSALFNRGETQGLSIVTLGGPQDLLLKVGLNGEKKQRYYHHYNFPPFSVGEVSNRLFTGNREIGHGALAERGIIPVLPSEDIFPYTIRVVTEILSSNGSSSMAATCGSTLALMAAGVPIKAPVSGVAMGLMTDNESGTYKILTDLQDEEDFGGDMDFKVTGTEKGITAIQMDIKIKGISIEIFKDALEQARIGRLKILKTMLSAIKEPRTSLSKYSPRLESLKIPTEKIRDLIGKGGETINKIIDITGVAIDISDKGLVTVTSAKDADMDKALEMIKAVTAIPEIGKVYNGKVIKIMDFGAFVEFMPGNDGLVHVSQMKKERVRHPSDVVKEGDIIKVKLLEIDGNGKKRLSMLDV